MKRIAVFAKRPTPGQVKTRLSPALPADLACDLYRAMIDDALAAISACSADERWIYWAGTPQDGGGADLATHGDVGRQPGAAAGGVRTHEQRGADLGARLEHGFTELLGADADRAVIIGADCPDLSAASLDRAFAALERNDLVLGPTRDGGYYLIGLRSTTPALFRGIQWSTSAVYAQTLERARQSGLSVTNLAPLADLDTPADLIRWIARAATEPAATASHTAAALARMGLLTTALA